MERTIKLYRRLAELCIAIQNCKKSGNSLWEERHTAELKSLVDRYMPHGSGFDNGTFIRPMSTSDTRLAFVTSYHHMDENGFYDGWQEMTVIVTPSLVSGISVRVNCRDKYDIRDYIADVFHDALTQDIAVEVLGR